MVAPTAATVRPLQVVPVVPVAEAVIQVLPVLVRQDKDMLVQLGHRALKDLVEVVVLGGLLAQVMVALAWPTALPDRASITAVVEVEVSVVVMEQRALEDWAAVVVVRQRQ